MARNKKTDQAVRAQATGYAAGSEAGSLTKAEVARIVAETAEQLLAVEGGEAKEWIEKGRIIAGYVERLQPNGKFSKPNPFALLAEREDIPWQTSQLRMYRDAYVLWRDMGGADGTSMVSVTTVGLVLPLDADEARKILTRAAKEKLATRQVAALVKKARGVGAAAKPERVTGDWKALGRALDSLDSEIGLMLDHPSDGPTDYDVTDRLEVVLASIAKLLASIGPQGGAQ